MTDLDFEFFGVKLVMTCGACPEQYDAYYNGDQIGYLRLRHGQFTVSYRDVGGKLVYQAEPNGDGLFEPGERRRYLMEAARKLLAEHGVELPKPVHVKQVIIMRDDLGMTKGKMVAQGAHASMGAIFNLNTSTDCTKMEIDLSNEFVRTWVDGAFTKICVRVTGEEELRDLVDKAKIQGIPAALITDNGLTMFKNVPTVTCGAIGPWSSEELDQITGHMTLY